MTTPPKGERPAGVDGAISEGDVASLAEVDTDLVRRADRVLRAALRAGLAGPQIDMLQDWVAQRRLFLRRRKAEAAVETVLAEIRGGAG